MSKKNFLRFPKTLKKAYKAKLSTFKKRKEVPSSYFLLPKERKFPYKNPLTGKVSYQLLMAAYKRAKQYGYEQVAQKAKRLLKRYFKEEVN